MGRTFSQGTLAMAAGLPIVAAKRGGIPEIVVDGKNGFITDHYDQPSAFADAIIKLLDSSSGLYL